MRNRHIVISTTSSLEGWTVQSHLDVVTAHVVAGANVFSDVFASFSDIFGGRSRSYQKQLASINDEAVRLLRQKASDLGANCIIGLRIDHDEVSGGGKSMFMVTVSGTAVVAERVESEISPVPEIQTTIDADDLDKLIKRKTITVAAKKGELWLGDKTWQFVCENQVHEVASYILKIAQQHLGRPHQQSSEKAVERSKQYFYSLPPETAKRYLYAALQQGTDRLRTYALDLLRDMNMLDLEEARYLLDSDDFETQKQALRVLHFDKPFYSQRDIEPVEYLKAKVENGFPKRGEVVEVERTFSSKTKTQWKCECGKQNDMNDTYCVSCRRDIYGFHKGATRPQETAQLLSTKLDVLKRQFAGNGTSKDDAV